MQREAGDMLTLLPRAEHLLLRLGIQATPVAPRMQ